MRRQGFAAYWAFRRPAREDFGAWGLAVRFLVNVAALWLAQWIVPGFDIEGAGALIFGALIFGIINAFIRPVVAMFSCLLTALTLGLFTLIINAAMLGLTAWIAGWFDVEFQVEGFLAAFFGALIIAVVSTLLSKWADENVLKPLKSRNRRW